MVENYMSPSMTSIAFQRQGNSGAFLSFTGFIFIACLPFSSVTHIGLLGNFDSNLSLYPFIPLIILVVAKGLLTDTLFSKGPEGEILRVLSLMFILAAIFTVANGFRFKSLGYFAYDLDPLNKSVVTSIVPLFIAVLYVTTTCVARYLEPRKLETALMLGFWLAVSYAALQYLSHIFPNPFYDFAWPIVEGAKDRGGVPYFAIFNRLNGPASEPADFVKILLILYLPWVIYSLNGKVQWGKFLIICFLSAVAQSIIGYLLLAFVFASLLLGNRINFVFKATILYLVLSAAIVVVLTEGEILGDISDRLSRLDSDASANVRAIYNLTALNVALDYPLIGIGWSNEVFLFPQRLSDDSYLWEIRQNIEEGVALTAKSLLLRLLMYTGIPLFFIVLVAIVTRLASRNLSGSEQDISRTRLTFMLLFIGGGVDGGIVTSFFMWAATALPLGYQMRKVHSAGYRNERYGVDSVQRNEGVFQYASTRHP
jgi:hypothetical protein